MRGRRWVPLAAAVLAVSSVGAAGIRPPALKTLRTSVDWPRFRFDQDHTGLQPFETILSPATAPFLSLLWQSKLGKVVDYSSPAVVGGVVYIGSSDGRLWAYSADGCGDEVCVDPLWKSASLAQIIDSPTVAGGVVYVGSQTAEDSNDGRLSAFAAGGCGEDVCWPMWQGLAGPDSILQSSPAVAGGFVYVGSFDGMLYVFPAAGCGALVCPPVWTGATGDHIESSPTVHGSTVYVGSNDGFLYAFPAAGCGQDACDPLWKGDAGETIFDSSPAVSGQSVYVGSVHHLNAFPLDGCGSDVCQPLWRGAYQDGFVNGSPAVYGDRVYTPVENFVGVFDAAGCGQPDCDPLWIDFASGSQPSILSSPTIANGVLYVGKMNGDLIAWPATPCGTFVCDQIWKYTVHHPILNSSPSVVDGRIYIGGGNSLDQEDTAGRIYVFGLA